MTKNPKYIMLITYSFDFDYISVPCMTKEEAVKTMNSYIKEEINTIRAKNEYDPVVLNLCDTEKIFVYAPDEYSYVDSANYYEYDYATYKVIEIFHIRDNSKGEE